MEYSFFVENNTKRRKRSITSAPRSARARPKFYEMSVCICLARLLLFFSCDAGLFTICFRRHHSRSPLLRCIWNTTEHILRLVHGTTLTAVTWDDYMDSRAKTWLLFFSAARWCKAFTSLHFQLCTVWPISPFFFLLLSILTTHIPLLRPVSSVRYSCIHAVQLDSGVLHDTTRMCLSSAFGSASWTSVVTFIYTFNPSDCPLGSWLRHRSRLQGGWIVASSQAPDSPIARHLHFGRSSGLCVMVITMHIGQSGWGGLGWARVDPGWVLCSCGVTVWIGGTCRDGGTASYAWLRKCA